MWPDTFSNSFHPEIGQAAVTVLERAGFTVKVPARPMCCGLTWTLHRAAGRGPAGAAPHHQGPDP